MLITYSKPNRIITLHADVAGYLKKNAENRYTLNNVTAKPNADGSYTIQFGGSGPNSLPIMPGWNYLVRMYRPRTAILDGI